MTNNTLTMPLDDAILASKALLNHASTDDIAPVIMGAAVVEHDGARYLVASDRYSFGRFKLGAVDTFDGEPGVIIPRDALLWVSKVIPKSLRMGKNLNAKYTIRITWTSDSDVPTIRAIDVEAAILLDGAVERSQRFDAANGNFPPVARLWKDDLSSEEPLSAVALSHKSLLKIAADIALFEGKDKAAVNLQFRSESGNKPGPVQYSMGPASRWTAGIQPNTLKK